MAAAAPIDDGRPRAAPDPFAVVVVAYQSAADVEGTVAAARSLPGCTTVVVVDNGTDGAGDLAESAGAVVVRRPDNPGFGTSQNLGVAGCAEPFVLLLNPDAVVDPVGLAAGRELLAGDPGAAVVQGAIRNRATGRPERSAGVELGPIHLVGRALGAAALLQTRAGRRLARVAGLHDHVDRVPTGPTDVESLAATAVLVRREAFEAVGGFSSDFFLYGEDLDLCHRLRLAGWRLVALDVPWAEHVSGGTAASAWDRELHWWRGTLRFGARWWGTPAWSLAVAASVVRWARLAAVRPRGAGAAWRALVAGPLGDRRARRRAG